MTTSHLIVLLCQLLAFLCFLAATFGVSARVNLVAAGLAFWAFTLLVG